MHTQILLNVIWLLFKLISIIMSIPSFPRRITDTQGEINTSPPEGALRGFSRSVRPQSEELWGNIAYCIGHHVHVHEIRGWWGKGGSNAAKATVPNAIIKHHTLT